MKKNTMEIFRKNLYRLRKERGLSQRTIAEKMKVSQRLVAYYECKAPNIPLTKVQDFADALEVSIVELLDTKQKGISEAEELDVRIIRKIKQIEKLPRRAQEALWHNINTTLEVHAGKMQKKPSK
jgi:transcriptional regulator with XRE-family HTH domain